jgi:CheY-like chemotaxis protein
VHSRVSIHSPLVLVVDDELEAADLLASLLLAHGCEVLVARDGEEALEIARELPRPDLVLLDLELPVMDGRRLLDAMRSDPSLSGIPVVVVSGAPDATTVRATDNVRKTRLLEGLERVLARLRPAGAAAAGAGGHLRKSTEESDPSAA